MKANRYAKPLRELLGSLDGEVRGNPDVLVEDVVFDSRQVRRGALNVALAGHRLDGHDFVREAEQAGASAVVVHKPVGTASATIVQVADTATALQTLAPQFWDHPSRRLAVVGITGTNGKTTVAYLVESALKAAGWAPGVLGTVNYRFAGRERPAPNTTPFPSDLQRFLAEVADGGGDACVMEVSSHALALGRVAGVEFDIAVFTNLTQDHLDFHGTLEGYAQAKKLLFAGLDPTAGTKRRRKRAVVNAEDPWTPRLLEGCRADRLAYGVRKDAEVAASDVRCGPEGSHFLLRCGSQESRVRLRLVGEFNVMNALAAAGCGWALGIPIEAIRKGLESIEGVPGRLESLREGQPFTVVVDYAHTEDALRQVLSALRRLEPARLICVFGCGGDRDRTKRPLMGEAAAQLSDEVIVTSDNPRSEDPARIALDIEVGIRRVRSSGYRIIPDREEALGAALRSARAGDIVLIAGKGHETYQIIGQDKIPFDDREIARRILRGSPRSAGLHS